ncbi:PD-(D/E)XK nuclease family protein [Microbacterium elymi]|uniref:PD-(D/E)XK nuclease family protein n=1 Tax=Microbacterium elymi TaxID=2909587 RepID=A0ABY5NK16_9MICO|nr:PD-(D/E)XK nuclease family protein [Microbacterium elymi]UUT35507.1 PD-(D/E)XK nuclease family protein [Microbacterium elymi]
MRAAADQVRAALSAPRPEPEDELALLLAEQAAPHGAGRSAPVRIPASRYKDFVADYAGTVSALARPLPERPFRQTRLGTLFHAWVERRSGLVGASGSLDDALWEGGDDDAAFSPADLSDLRTLQAAFEQSEWAALQPIEVETEIDFRFTGLDEQEHLAICKLDAVYRRGDRIEIVDWKTGAPPRDQAARESRMLRARAVPSRVPRTAWCAAGLDRRDALLRRTRAGAARLSRPECYSEAAHRRSAASDARSASPTASASPAGPTQSETSSGAVRSGSTAGSGAAEPRRSVSVKKDESSASNASVCSEVSTDGAAASGIRPSRAMASSTSIPSSASRSSSRTVSARDASSATASAMTSSRPSS